MSEDMASHGPWPRPDAGPGPGPGRRPRKKYSAPQLIEWGSLLELTRGGAGAAVDYDLLTTKAV